MAGLRVEDRSIFCAVFETIACSNILDDMNPFAILITILSDHRFIIMTRSAVNAKNACRIFIQFRQLSCCVAKADGTMQIVLESWR